MRMIPVIAASTLALSLVAGQAMAYQAGDVYVRGEFEKSDIDDNNNVSRENAFGLAGGYLFSDKLGMELGLGEDVEHDYQVGSQSGTLDRMPVNLLVQYYPLGGIEAARVQPFIGVGLNYTRFSSVSGAGMDVDDSYGVVGQLGMDLTLTENISATGFARYADVEAEFEQGGQGVADVSLNPLTVGAGVTYRF